MKILFGVERLNNLSLDLRFCDFSLACAVNEPNHLLSLLTCFIASDQSNKAVQLRVEVSYSMKERQIKYVWIKSFMQCDQLLRSDTNFF